MQKVFLGNLDWHATEADVRQYAESVGLEVLRVSVSVDPTTGRSRGFAFVEVADTGGDAVSTLDGGVIMGRPVHAEIPREKPRKSGFRDGSRGWRDEGKRSRSSRREGGAWD